jgi:hypothetical protein
VACRMWLTRSPTFLRRATMVFIVGALVTVISGCRGGSSRSDKPALPPLRPLKIGEMYVCPYDFVAYTSPRRVFYPRGHPARPSKTVRPTECFASSRDARAAGYVSAPVPPNSALIGGIYIVPASQSLIKTCRRAQNMLPYPIYCPTRVPSGWHGDVCPVAGCGVFKLIGFFDAPSDYVGSEPNQGHINFWGMPTRDRDTFGGGCPGTAPTRRIQFRGRPASFFNCPEGSSLDSGHVLLEWHEGRFAYGVSAHGVSDVNRQLVLYLARHIEPAR